MIKGIAVVAVGGNALIIDDNKTSIADQYIAVKQNAAHIADMIEAGWRVVLTHGNGPQVGFILRRSELAQSEVSPVPVDYAVADTQGAIGYMFQQALANELSQRQIHKPIASVVTQTLVDINDPAFSNPTKPIGAFLDHDTAVLRQQQLGWSIMQDSGRGWRRTIPSPTPLEIIEKETITQLLNSDCLVIACGGGGIPVVRNTKRELQGAEAVIDKDLASALLAKQLNADLLLISTGVEQVAINFGKPNQQGLHNLTLKHANQLIEQGQFAAGSMLPKIEAMIDYLQANPNGKGLITSPPAIKSALAGNTGTWLTH